MGGVSIGYTIVTVFFMMSGALLWMNDRNIYDKESVLDFYKNRISVLAPSYYITWIIFAIGILFINDRLHYYEERTPSTIIFSLFGVDKYFGNGDYKTFGLAGEWFLGAIVIVYLIFPIIILMYKANKWVCLFNVFSLYYLLNEYNSFGISSFRNPFTCALSFVIGIISVDEKLIREKICV